MKSVKAFGKSIPIIVILAVVLSASLAGAALVNYLSNVVTTTTTVESPVELKLFNPDGTEITAFTLRGGESVDFSKIAYNKGENGVPFAIALVIKGEDVGDAVIVDSAGPRGDKETIGNALWIDHRNIWNDGELWWQVEDDMWYLHGADDVAKVEAYKSYLKYSTSIEDPQVTLNDVYVDAVAVTIGSGSYAGEYYVVIFGGTIGGSAPNQIDQAQGTNAEKLALEVTNWGWGSVNQETGTIYHPRTSGDPCVMGGESFDVGKVRIIFASNFVTDEETVEIGMSVVVPGATIAEIIADMNLLG